MTWYAAHVSKGSVPLWMERRIKRPRPWNLKRKRKNKGTISNLSSQSSQICFSTVQACNAKALYMDTIKMTKMTQILFGTTRLVTTKTSKFKKRMTISFDLHRSRIGLKMWGFRIKKMKISGLHRFRTDLKIFELRSKRMKPIDLPK